MIEGTEITFVLADANTDNEHLAAAGETMMMSFNAVGPALGWRAARRRAIHDRTFLFALSVLLPSLRRFASAPVSHFSSKSARDQSIRNGADNCAS